MEFVYWIVVLVALIAFIAFWGIVASTIGFIIILAIAAIIELYNTIYKHLNITYTKIINNK